MAAEKRSQARALQRLHAHLARLEAAAGRRRALGAAVCIQRRWRRVRQWRRMIAVVRRGLVRKAVRIQRFWRRKGALRLMLKRCVWVLKWARGDLETLKFSVLCACVQ